MPAVTNTTACQNGWFSGWKDWCINHAVNCVQNITRGIFPPMILQTREQYLAGAKAANGSGISMCPIGENAAFCTGWDSNNGVDYDHECCDAYINYTGPGLIGCPLDVMKPNQIGAAALPVLVGTWSYVNQSILQRMESKAMGAGQDMQSMPMTSLGISGKIVYGANGDVNMTIPSKTAFGDTCNSMI
jgi:hypothetical protein